MDESTMHGEMRGPAGPFGFRPGCCRGIPQPQRSWRVLGFLLVLAAAALWHPDDARAQAAPAAAADPNLDHPQQLIKVARDGYEISALVTHRADPQPFRHAIALFPGYPGILRLREEEGQLRFDLRGNFLLRSRRHWLDDDILVTVVDAPSDQWATFSQRWRETQRYGADVAALLDELSFRYKVADWTFVGTSEGTVSAFHAAQMNPTRIRRLIQTASVFGATRNGPGLSGIDLAALPAATLWVHHEDDPCAFTTYRDAKDFAARSGKPLLTMRGGGPGRGGACEPYTAHGFVGVERETVRAMLAWVRSGALPADTR
jgi:pimeloyl-ACP methyl ester carboxylesterase